MEEAHPEQPTDHQVQWPIRIPRTVREQLRALGQAHGVSGYEYSRRILLDAVRHRRAIPQDDAA